MTNAIYLKPLWVRLWHWSNALLIIALTVTGVSLHFADPKVPLLEFARAEQIHSLAGILLVLAYTVFLIGNLRSGRWRVFLPEKSPARHLAQVKHYLWGVFKGESEPFPVTPEAPFNALQALVYCFIMFVAMPAMVVTGLVFYFPQLAPAQAFGYDGLLPVAVAHYVIAAVIVMFLIGHVYLGTMGRTLTSSFKTMITGWHHH